MSDSVERTSEEEESTPLVQYDASEGESEGEADDISITVWNPGHSRDAQKLAEMTINVLRFVSVKSEDK